MKIQQESLAQKYCDQCGVLIEDGALFCAGCGTNVLADV